MFKINQAIKKVVLLYYLIKARSLLYKTLKVELGVFIPSLRGLIYGSRISNFAKPASNWFKKNLRAVSHGRTHMTNFKILEH